jgi:hypothetical protein
MRQMTLPAFSAEKSLGKSHVSDYLAQFFGKNSMSLETQQLAPFPTCNRSCLSSYIDNCRDIHSPIYPSSACIRECFYRCCNIGPWM